MTFSIVITTYQKKDGTTPILLKRALDSIFSQEYQNFKVYIIGDRYENNDEFISICSSYDPKKMYYENLPFAFERDRYTDKWLIWSYAGCFANNYGINKAISDGFTYVCHLDHDDWWLPNHLTSLKMGIDRTNSPFICTKSEYVGGRILPEIISDQEFIDYLPMGGKLIHSSVCIDFKKIPLRHRNIYEETGRLGVPGDWDLWDRIGRFFKENNLIGCLINKVTCVHIEEGYERR